MTPGINFGFLKAIAQVHRWLVWPYFMVVPAQMSVCLRVVLNRYNLAVVLLFYGLRFIFYRFRLIWFTFEIVLKEPKGFIRQKALIDMTRSLFQRFPRLPMLCLISVSVAQAVQKLELWQGECWEGGKWDELSPLYELHQVDLLKKLSLSFGNFEPMLAPKIAAVALASTHDFQYDRFKNVSSEGCDQEAAKGEEAVHEATYVAEPFEQVVWFPLYQSLLLTQLDPQGVEFVACPIIFRWPNILSVWIFFPKANCCKVILFALTVL